MELFVFLILCCLGVLFWRDSKSSFDQNFSTTLETSKEPEYPILTNSIDSSKLSSLLDMDPYYDCAEGFPFDVDAVVDPDLDSKES